MDFLNVITLGVVLIGIFVSVQLLFNSRSIATRLLALYLFCMAMFLVEPVVTSGIIRNIISLLLAFLTFASGPALYLYTILQLKSCPWRNRYFLHFMPASIILTLVLLSLPVQSAKASQDSDELILYLLFIVQLLTYTGAAIVSLARHRARFSSGTVERMQTNFVRWMVYGSMILFLFSAISTMIGWNQTQIFVHCIQLLLSAVIFIIALLNGDVLDRRERYVS